MEVEIIQDVSKFRDMRSEWDALLEKSDTCSIYLSWEWLYTWWEIFGPHCGRRLFIITARQDGSLVGIAPFIKHKIKTCWIINRIRFEFLGTGENAKDEVCSNYMDFIVEPGMENDFVREVASLLASIRDGFNEVVLSSVSENSPIISSFVELLKVQLINFKYKITNTSSCLFINLPSDWESYLQSLGSKTRRNIRRDRKLLTDKGLLEYSTYADSGSYKYLDAVVKLHKRRWQENKEEDMFSSKLFLGFHEKLSNLFAEKGWLKIGILTNNGQMIAASYHFMYKNRLFAYQVGCDDAYDKRLSVGIAEFGFSIEEAIKAKCKEYDFYKASRKGYKALLGKDWRNVIDVRIARDDFVEKSILAMKKIKTLLVRKGY